MRKIYGILFLVMLICLGCQWHLTPGSSDAKAVYFGIQRYDRIENLYLTTGDYSALQQMNTYFPNQTRMLIEDLLRLGPVNEADVNKRFLYFFQDSTLQEMLGEVQRQYADVDDLNAGLSDAFNRLKEDIPSLVVPEVYTLIGSFDQSIIVGNGMLGICLDKYLGSDYPFYVSHYSDEQRKMMTRSMIVPDCLGFYLLSLYPMLNEATMMQWEKDVHMGCIQWVVNRAVGESLYDNAIVRSVDRYMRLHTSSTVDELLKISDYSLFL